MWCHARWEISIKGVTACGAARQRVSSRIWARSSRYWSTRPASAVYLSQIPLSRLHPVSSTLIQSSIIPGSQCSRVFVCWFYSLSPIALSLFIIFRGRTSMSSRLSALYLHRYNFLHFHHHLIPYQLVKYHHHNGFLVIMFSIFYWIEKPNIVIRYKWKWEI